MFLNKKKIQNLNSMYLNLKKVIILIMSKGKKPKSEERYLAFHISKKKIGKIWVKGNYFLNEKWQSWWLKKQILTFLNEKVQIQGKDDFHIS